MKAAPKLLKTLLLLTAFCVSSWFFMPWRQVGTAVLTEARRHLETRGAELSFAGVEAVSGGFQVRNLNLSSFARFSFRTLTLKPHLLDSLLVLTPVCSVTFEGAEAVMGQPMSLGDGGATVTLGPDSVLLEGLRSNGEFSLNGFLAIDPGAMRIARANAAVRVPQSFEENMEALQAFLPLVREGSGRWFLRREEARASQ
ncbi:MAG: hypothetical protein GX256_02345 [Fretibacterium sp.]|nr:hypothetical protein [Fretibacterium sp.]